jgi:adenylate kinase
VPDEVIVAVIIERISRPEADDGFILDGFPRTRVQAEALDDEVGRVGRSLTATIFIDGSDDEVLRRLGGRRTCRNGHIFHVEFDPPEREGVCDVCGEPLAVRDDDKPEVISKRLENYHRDTEPLVGYYDERGLLHRIDGTESPDQVYAAIRATLATLRMEEEA